MWLIAIMILLMLPMTAAALVYLVSAAWRFLEALLQGTIGAVRITWHVAAWSVRATIRATGLAQRGAHRLRHWHYAGTTWAGQYLESSWRAWANMARRRYVAGQLRRLRKDRHAHHGSDE